MKQSRLMFLIASIIAIMAIYFNFFEYNNIRENLLSDLADPKEDYALLLEGRVAFQGDTVSFDLIPAVHFAIHFMERDIITIKKADGRKVIFTRRMVNNWNIPAPTEDGKKAMTSWTSDAANEKEEKEFFYALKNVLQNGRCQYTAYYGGVVNLEKKFTEVYNTPPEKAKQLAERAANPLFSSLD